MRTSQVSCFAARSVAALSFAILASGCPAPEPTDDTPAPGEADGCGDVTAQGLCEGDVLTYCDEAADELIIVDCSTAFTARAATCTEISEAFGSDCAVAVGEDCVLDDGTLLFCQGTSPGCFDTTAGFACVEGLGSCVLEDEGTCNGELLLAVCNVIQPFVVDCQSYGGTCSDVDDACLMAAGAFCDGVDFKCRGGLTCSENTCS